MNRPEGFEPAPLPEGQAARLTALLDALGAIPISAAERLSLTWLAGFEVGTVERIAAVIRRARDRSAVIAARRHDPELQRMRRALDAADDEVISRHREANRAVTAAAGYRRQLVELCKWAGIDPGPDPHAALLAHLRSRAGLPGRIDPFRLALDAIGLFLEYRDQHGRTEDEARGEAALEVAEGAFVAPPDDETRGAER